MITITKEIAKATCVTHAGNFHADDVFSTVFLDKLFNDICVIRLKDYQDDKSKLTFDIGLGKFDHHQKNAKIRENKIHYCGFGLLWQEFGMKYLKKIKVTNIEDTFKVFDELFVMGLDAFDNGELNFNTNINIYTISDLVELFRPKDKEDEDECFLQACTFASQIFDKILNEVIKKVEGIEKIKKTIPKIKDKILVLEEYFPYEYALFYLNMDINFVIYPSNRGGYAVHTVPKTYKSFEPKVPFLKSWGGLRDQELQKVSEVATARFCHSKLFLATADTLKDAKSLAYKASKK